VTPRARLPIPLPPARHELVTSYISRLANQHGIGFTELWTQISTPHRPGTRRRRVLVEQLTALTGRSHRELAGALLELRDPAPDWRMFRHEPQPGCPRCDAHHPGGPVIRLLPHHRYLCHRHQYWIGPPDIPAPPTPLTALPDIITAQRRHLRLQRRRGWAATYDAVLTGFLICGHLWSHPAESPTDVWHHWPRRTRSLIGNPTTITFTASRVFAAVYPEAVALAAVIASPLWRQRAHGNPAQRHHFAAEIGRRLGRPGYQPREVEDALAH